MGGGSVAHGMGRGRRVAGQVGVGIQCRRDGRGAAIPTVGAAGSPPVPVWAIGIERQFRGRRGIFNPHPTARGAHYGFTGRLVPSRAPEGGRGLVILQASAVGLIPQMLVQLHLLLLPTSGPMRRC